MLLKGAATPQAIRHHRRQSGAPARRFNLEHLADLHARFLARGSDQRLSTEEAIEQLEAHVPTGITEDALLSPRIVLLGEDFSPTVTSSVVRLNEQGVDVTLRRYLAYKTASGEMIVTVSTLYPLPGIEAFEARPKSRVAEQVDPLPERSWTEEDLTHLRSLPFEVPHAILDLCAAAPGQWITSRQAYEHAGVTQAIGMGKLARFGFSVRTRFKRSNSPWESRWNVHGDNLRSYRVDEDTAVLWKYVHDAQAREQSGEAGDVSADDSTEVPRDPPASTGSLKADASANDEAATKKPWRASDPSVAPAVPRAVKASPSGGLRPALTALALFQLGRPE